jgi:hypothetical protein
MNAMITVEIFQLPQELYILKTVLERESIPYYFENETIVSIDPFASIALGGIKLKVHPENKERTLQLLEDLNNPLSIV